MATQQPSEALSIEEFIALPNTIDLIFQYTRALQQYVDNRPYLRLGKVVRDYAIVYTQQENLQTILDELGESGVNIMPMVMGLLGRQDLDEAGITQVQDQPYLNLKGQGVLIAFVDTGIDYTNQAFRFEDGTSKIQYIWDQTIPGNAPEGYYFGTEYTNAQINEALQSENPFALVPTQDNVGHGTFLASVAASRENNAYIGAAPDAQLIVVKLQKARSFYLEYYLVPQDQQNVYASSDLMLGLQYILERAYELRQPTSIGISIGTNLGGHDGLGNLETYVTTLCGLQGVAVSVAPGNESAMKHHVSGVIEEAGDTKDIEIRAGDNGAPIFMNLWTPASDKTSIAVTSPTGEVINRIPFKPGTTLESKLVLEKARVIVSYVFPVEGSGSQLTMIKIIDPTPGVWKITIFGDNIIDGTYHAWLPLTGLVDPQIEFLEPDPEYTIVVPATALGTITSGAYNSQDNSLYISSSRGPTRLPAGAPVMAAPGVNVSGVFPTGYGTMTGTSVSAAITAGACALGLQWGVVERTEISMTSFLLRSYFIKGCIRDPQIEYPNNQWGYGRLNLINTFNQMGE